MAFAIDVGTQGRTSAEVHRARDPSCAATLLLAHGAGAPRTHPFMVDMARRLAGKGIDVVTFNFLYAEAGRKMPDRTAVLEACFEAVLAAVRARRGLPSERLFVGGKSMGGRIAARIANAHAEGLVVFGYPLHPPGKPLTVRDEIVAVTVPRLVVQGTRDPFGSARELAKKVGRASVHAVAEGDHSLVLPRRLGAAAQERALDGVAERVAAFVRAGA